jgi:hypothetical protein
MRLLRSLNALSPETFQPGVGRTGRRQLRAASWEGRDRYRWSLEFAHENRGSADIRPGNSSNPWLAYRAEFREILRQEPIVGLARCVRDDDGASCRLAIWLLGKLGGKVAIGVVAARRYDPDARIRRRVVKALLRMGAWRQLREMAREDPEPVIRRIAAYAERSPTDFNRRMSHFVQHNARRRDSGGPRSSEQQLVCLTNSIGGGRPPKSRFRIRAILEHIRALVGRHRAKKSPMG